jgi:DNA-binding CsgD family transcriptional regulator
MNIPLRRTGVNILGDVPWGSHLCMFYDSQDDLLDAVIPYFKAGLESNEFCVWALPPPLTLEEAHLALSQRIPDFDRYLAAGRMEITPAQEWYLDGGHFDIEKITAAWDEKVRAASAKGCDGLRVSGTAFWLHAQHWKDYCDYERLVNKAFEGKPITALCTFPIVASGAADMLEVVRAHHFAVARRNGKWELIEPVQATETDRSLTPREREVLWWAGEGKSAQEIAKILRIAKRTVDEHTQKAVRKLGAANRTQAVAIALRERLIGKRPPERSRMGYTSTHRHE